MRSVAAVTICLLLGLSGCVRSTGSEPDRFTRKTGKNCTVQFRRGDVLGGGGGLPVPPLTGSINGADVSVTGKLQSIDLDWVVIQQEKREFAISRESILLIEFHNTY